MTAPPHHNVALVTGAGGGLGQVLVTILAAAGFRIMATDVDTQALARIASLGDPHVTTALLDVTSPAQWQTALDQITQRWGGLGVLVNNSAITRTTPLFEIAAEEFDAVVAVALKGTFLGCQVAGRHMAEQGYGRIINLASLAGQNGGSATGAHYAAAKGGIVTLTKVFARELAARGVTVNAVAPGPLDLDSVRSLLPPDKLEAVTRSIPVGALGNPQFVAQMLTMLIQPDASFATGATFDINGGLYMR